MLDTPAIAKKLGLPETAFEDEKKFDEAFNDSKTGYIARAKAVEDEGIAKHFNDHVGKRMGALEVLTRKAFKEGLGIEELESGTLEKMLEDGADKAKALLTKWGEDSKKNNDTRITELTSEVGSYKTKWESEKERAEKANQLLATTQGEFENYKTNLKSTQLFQSELGKIELIPDMSELQKKGYHTLIAEAYEFKLDKDGEALEVYHKGQTKWAKNEAGNQNLTVEEALKALAEKNGLLRKNNITLKRTFAEPQHNGTQERIPRTAQTLERNPKLA